MTQNNTQPQIQSHILLLLRRWIANEPPPPGGTTRLGRALKAQSTLGAWNTILGRISTQISSSQTRFYARSHSRRTGHRWTVGLIQQLQNISWAMWDHRNGVLHKDPTRHYQRDLMDTTNQEISKEWQTGGQGLLTQDRFLFRDRAGVNLKTLPQKLDWLDAVAMARAAAAADDANRTSYEHERAGLRQWLLSPSTRVSRNGTQTTNTTAKTNKKDFFRKLLPPRRM